MRYRKNRTTLLTVVILALALVAGACSSGEGDSTTTTTTAGGDTTTTTTSGATTTTGATGTTTPQEEEQIDRIRVATNGNIITVDTTQSHQVSSLQVMILTAGLLFRWNADHEPVPELVEDWELSDDGLVYTMTLHDGLVFSDGSPLTSEDVVFTWNRVKDAPPVVTTLVDMVETVEAPDDRTIVWTLSRPNPDFLQWFGHQYLTIHPKALIESDPNYFEHPVSSGPYTLNDWVPNSPTARLVANPNYIGGTPAVEEIEFVFVPDMTTRVLQLANGEIDYVTDLPAAVRDSLPPEVETFSHPIGGTYFIVINEADDGALADRDVRHAMSLVLDRNAVCERAFFGISQPMTSLLYTGPESVRNVLPNGASADLAAAQERMAQSGYPDGFSFELQTWGNRPGWLDASLVIQEQLAQLGIEVEVTSLEDSVAIDNLVTGNYQAQFSGTAGFPEILLYGSTVQEGGIWANFSGYQNAEIQPLIAEAASELDDDRRYELFRQIEDLHFVDLTFIPMCERVELHGSRVPSSAFGIAKFGQYPYIGVLGD